MPVTHNTIFKIQKTHANKIQRKKPSRHRRPPRPLTSQSKNAIRNNHVWDFLIAKCQQAIVLNCCCVEYIWISIPIPFQSRRMAMFGKLKDLFDWRVMVVGRRRCLVFCLISISYAKWAIPDDIFPFEMACWPLATWKSHTWLLRMGFFDWDVRGLGRRRCLLGCFLCIQFCVSFFKKFQTLCYERPACHSECPISNVQSQIFLTRMRNIWGTTNCRSTKR